MSSIFRFGTDCMKKRWAIGDGAMGHRYEVHMYFIFRGMLCEERVYRAKGCVGADKGKG